jgi:rhomboid family GlyGly-CTERM serine protease
LGASVAADSNPPLRRQFFRQLLLQGTFSVNTLQSHFEKALVLARSVGVTLSVCLLAALAACFQPITAALEFDRAAIVADEWWRMVGGHITHWNADHLMWDGLMFAVLGALCERRSRPRFLLCLALSALAISGGIWWLLPAIESYRGLSGIDSALFTLAAATMLADARHNGDRVAAAVVLATLAGFAAKLTYEMLTGDTLFVDSAAAGFVPLPLAHVVGGCVGLAISRLGSAPRAAGSKVGASKSCLSPA